MIRYPFCYAIRLSQVERLHHVGELTQIVLLHEQDALPVPIALDEVAAQGNILTITGQCYESLGQWQEALLCYQQALSCIQKVNGKEAPLLVGLARCYSHRAPETQALLSKEDKKALPLAGEV